VTSDQFDAAIAAAKLELKRARTAECVCRLYGSGDTSHQLARIANAIAAIDALKATPVFLDRLKRRADEKNVLKRARNKRFAEANKDRLREKARDRAARARDSGAAAEYRSMPHVRQQILKSKERARRQRGAIPLFEVKAAAVERANERARQIELSRNAKNEFIRQFVGPPKPALALTDAQYYSWRMRNEPEFYVRELDRAQRYKARTRPGYRDSIVPWAATPTALKEAKHLQYLIGREINRRSDNENNQPTA
jgi:hypothetical protein